MDTKDKSFFERPPTAEELQKISECVLNEDESCCYYPDTIGKSATIVRIDKTIPASEIRSKLERFGEIALLKVPASDKNLNNGVAIICYKNAESREILKKNIADLEFGKFSEVRDVFGILNRKSKKIYKKMIRKKNRESQNAKSEAPNDLNSKEDCDANEDHESSIEMNKIDATKPHDSDDFELEKFASKNSNTQSQNSEKSIANNTSKAAKERFIARVTNFSPDTYMFDLTAYLKENEGVKCVRIPQSKETGKKRGVAYVDFLNEVHLNNFLAKNHVWEKRTLTCCKGDPMYKKKDHKDFKKQGDDTQESNTAAHEVNKNRYASGQYESKRNFRENNRSDFKRSSNRDFENKNPNKFSSDRRNFENRAKNTDKHYPSTNSHEYENKNRKDAYQNRKNSYFSRDDNQNQESRAFRQNRDSDSRRDVRSRRSDHDFGSRSDHMNHSRDRRPFDRNQRKENAVSKSNHIRFDDSDDIEMKSTNRNRVFYSQSDHPSKHPKFDRNTQSSINKDAPQKYRERNNQSEQDEEKAKHDSHGHKKTFHTQNFDNFNSRLLKSNTDSAEDNTKKTRIDKHSRDTKSQAKRSDTRKQQEKKNTYNFGHKPAEKIVFDDSSE